jgi:FkbM family methyltransferase
MYFFKSRLKDSLRALTGRHYIQSVPFQKILDRIGTNKIRNFIQIGSNDGMKNDPLRKNILAENWKGILVEPDYNNFQKLVQNYSGATGLEFENIGIAERDGSMTFHYIEGVNEKDPGWFDQIGSFDENTFRKNISFSPELVSRHKTREIQVMTIGTLIQKYQIHFLDLLHTDTEGYDFKILNEIDFGKLTPRIIIFESEWMTSFELKELLDKFRSHQYEIFKDGIDHIACKAYHV